MSAVSPMEAKNTSSRKGLTVTSSDTRIPVATPSSATRTANSSPPTIGSGML